MNDLDALTPEARTLSTQIRKRERIEAREPVINNAFKILLGLLVVYVVALTVWIWASNAASHAGDDRLDAAIASIQDDLKNVCRKVSSESLAPSEKDSCYRAEANIPPSQVTAIQQAPSQSLLDNALLLDAVKKRVDDYLASHPMPTSADLVPLIRQVYNDNKPADGKTPTDAELLALVTKVYSANPPVDGKDATQAQADAAIKNYCESKDPSPCQGPKGDRGNDGTDGTNGTNGVDGRGITNRYYEWDPDDPTQCREVTEYNQAPTPVYINVGSSLCAEADKPSVSPTT